MSATVAKRIWRLDRARAREPARSGGEGVAIKDLLGRGNARATDVVALDSGCEPIGAGDASFLGVNGAVGDAVPDYRRRAHGRAALAAGGALAAALTAAGDSQRSRRWRGQGRASRPWR